MIVILNIAKGTTDPGIEFILPIQSNFLGSYHKFKHKSWSNFIFRISTKHQLLNQASAFPINLKFKILTKLSFENLTKIQLHNLQNISGKMLNKLQLPNQQTVANMILSINISKSNNLNKFWVGIFTRQGHINQVY